MEHTKLSICGQKEDKELGSGKGKISCLGPRKEAIFPLSEFTKVYV